MKTRRGRWSGGVLGCAVALWACGPSVAPTLGTVEGTLPVSNGAGDAYLFLSLTSDPVRPRYATAISDARIAAGDDHYVFANVAPGDYALSGFLDSRFAFRPDVDVLAQARAGDRMITTINIAVDASVLRAPDLVLGPVLRDEPPAFSVPAPEGVVTLPDQPLVPVSVELDADPLGVLDPAATHFVVTLIDANGDGVPDDANGDGIPDLSPTLLLHFLPRPGQTVPLDATGAPEDVVVPLLFNPGPFLLALGGRLDARVTVDRLTAFVVPQAQAVTLGPNPVVTALPVIPVGDYELVALETSGQLWRVPNGLRATSPSQAVRFSFVHASGLGVRGRGLE